MTAWYLLLIINIFLEKKKRILNSLNCKLFFDNTGFFKQNLNYFKKKGINYKLAGSENWL